MGSIEACLVLSRGWPKRGPCHFFFSSTVLHQSQRTPTPDYPEQVLAVFPDTTSFYRGTISKQPVRKGGLVSEVSLGGYSLLCCSLFCVSILLVFAELASLNCFCASIHPCKSFLLVHSNGADRNRLRLKMKAVNDQPLASFSHV